MLEAEDEPKRARRQRPSQFSGTTPPFRSVSGGRRDVVCTVLKALAAPRQTDSHSLFVAAYGGRPPRGPMDLCAAALEKLAAFPGVAVVRDA